MIVATGFPLHFLAVVRYEHFPNFPFWSENRSSGAEGVRNELGRLRMNGNIQMDEARLCGVVRYGAWTRKQAETCEAMILGRNM